jgi:hypothetical protein
MVLGHAGRDSRSRTNLSRSQAYASPGRSRRAPPTDSVCSAAVRPEDPHAPRTGRSPHTESAHRPAGPERSDETQGPSGRHAAFQAHRGPLPRLGQDRPRHRCHLLGRAHARGLPRPCVHDHRPRRAVRAPNTPARSFLTSSAARPSSTSAPPVASSPSSPPPAPSEWSARTSRAGPTPGRSTSPRSERTPCSRSTTGGLDFPVLTRSATGR